MANKYRADSINAINRRKSETQSNKVFYKSHWGIFKEGPPPSKLTERQKTLLDGTCSGEIRKRDVVRLLNKLEAHERYEDAARLYDLYGYMFHEVCEGDPTPKEAEEILRRLTPDDLK